MEYFINLGTSEIISIFVPFLAAIFAFVLIRFHDRQIYNQESHSKLKGLVNNLIIELDFNKSILEKTNKLIDYTYIRNFYFNSSLNSGLFYLIKNTAIQKMMPGLYLDLESYKKSSYKVSKSDESVLRNEFLATDFLSSISEQKNMAETKDRSIRVTEHLLQELKTLIKNL